MDSAATRQEKETSADSNNNTNPNNNNNNNNSNVKDVVYLETLDDSNSSINSLDLIDEGKNNKTLEFESQDLNEYDENDSAFRTSSAIPSEFLKENNYETSYTNLSAIIRPQSETSSYTSSMSPRRLSSIYGANNNTNNFLNGTFTNLFGNNDQSVIDESKEYHLKQGASKSCCLECGAYAYLVRCASHCEMQICENCQQKHWQLEINELIKIKSYLENSVTDLRKYLTAKKSQCNENIKSGQQMKKFINLTMQQIKRKVELELENKRDELFNSIDAFVENQKKIGQSINEDTFQTSERICNEIENLLLMPDNDVNLLKIKSLKTFARSTTQKLNQQKSSRVPLYSIFFVPDSTIQVNNSFGKIVLKSHDPENSQNDLSETLNDNFNLDESLGYPNYENMAEFSFLNGRNNIDATQILSRQNRIQSSVINNSRYNENSMYETPDNISINRRVLNNLINGPQSNESNGTAKRATSLFANRNSFLSNTQNLSNFSLVSNNSTQNSMVDQTSLNTKNTMQPYQFRSLNKTNESYNLPDRYEEVLNRKLEQQEKKEETQKKETLKEGDTSETIQMPKPFVPGRILMGQNQQNSSNKNTGQIKEIKVTHKTPKTFTQISNDSNTDSNKSKNSSSSSYTTTSSSPSPPLEQPILQKSFKQQGQKLVNF